MNMRTYYALIARLLMADPHVRRCGPEPIVTEQANHAMRMIESRLWLSRWQRDLQLW